MNLQPINASASPEVQLNENFETLDHQSVYGLRQPATTGLTWGYCGGRWGGFSVAAATLSLTGAATNYVVVAIATGAISVATTSTNWDDATNYVRVYKLTTDASAVTAIEDHRAGPQGVHGGGGGGGSGGSTQGKHGVQILAGAMQPSLTAGCAPLAFRNAGSGQPDYATLDFSNSTEEYAQFALPMPKKWDCGTVTAKFFWTAPTGSSGGVAWSLQGVAISDDDPIAVSFGTRQIVADTFLSAVDLHVSSETPALTIAGTPQAEDMVFFRVARVVADASDTLGVDARLIAVVVYITTSADTDA